MQGRALIATVLLSSACQSPSTPKQPVVHVSTQLEALEERIELVERYVPGSRTYEELEYRITHHDHSGGLVPGPSDWNVTLLARIPCEEIGVWAPDPEALVEREPPSWIERIPGELDASGISQWMDTSHGEVGVDSTRCLIAYRYTTR